MIPPYKKEEFEEKFAELEKMPDKKADEFFFKYMKMIISFGRPVRITEKGYKKGLELYEVWKKGTELTREENLLIGFMLSDVCILEEDPDMMQDLNTMYNQMITKYNPDFQYLQEFGQTFLIKSGFVESNPHYMQSIENMFTTDYVLPDAEQLRMISTGEMPIYDKVKVCPYCGKQFGDNAELLFKHVKAEHGKK